MHNDYLETFPDSPCSYEMYRKCICAENASFTKLGEEQCEVCLAYHSSHNSKMCKSNEENDKKDEQTRASDAQCNACLQLRNQTERARKARKLYRQDTDTKWSDDYSVRSADWIHHGDEDQIRKQPGGNVYDFSDLYDDAVSTVELW